MAAAALMAFGVYALYQPGSAVSRVLADHHHKQAMHALGRGEWLRARSRYRAALQRDSWHRAARWSLFEGELARGHADQAFLHLQAYVELFPEDARGWAALAQALSAGGAAAESEVAADRAVAQAPDALAYRLLRAELRWRNSRLAGALADLDHVLAHEPAHPRATGLRQEVVRSRDAEAAQQGAGVPVRRGRGQYWPRQLADAVAAVLQAVRAQDWEAAEARALQAQADYPATMFGPWLQGVVAVNEGHMDEAEAHFLRALERAPRSHRVLTLLTRLWARRDGAAAAGDRLMALARHDPGFALPWEIALQAYVEARLPTRAEAAMRRGLDMPAAGVIPYRRLADLYQQLDQPQQALQIAQAGLAHTPGDHELSRSLPGLLHRAGQGDEALRAYRRHLEQWPSDRRIAAEMIHHLLQEPTAAALAEAEGLAERLVGDHATEAYALDALGRLALAQRDPVRGQAYAQAAVAADPDEPRYIYRLGAARAAMGDRAGALRALERALQTPQGFPERLEALRLRNRLNAASASTATDGQ